MRTPSSDDIQFFFDHAGWSYDPATESPDEGRSKCATSLAFAEMESHANGYLFLWEVDRDCDSSEFCDDEPAWSLWICHCEDRFGNVVASLCGVDFGRDCTPHGKPYARVVEAELALEALSICN